MLQMIFTVTIILGIVINLFSLSSYYSQADKKIIRGYGWSMIVVGVSLTAVFWS